MMFPSCNCGGTTTPQPVQQEEPVQVPTPEPELAPV